MIYGFLFSFSFLTAVEYFLNTLLTNNKNKKLNYVAFDCAMGTFSYLNDLYGGSSKIDLRLSLFILLLH